MDPEQGENDILFHTLVERSMDGIAIVQDTRLVYVNDRLGEILGYSAAELLNTQYIRYAHPDEIQNLSEHYNRRMSGEFAPELYESAVLNRDGERVEVEINAGVITFQDRPADFVFIRDISARKRFELALRRSEEQSRSLIQHLSDMVLVLDEEMRIKFETPSVERVLGYPPGELVGRNGLDLVHPDDLPVVQRDLEEVFRFENTLEPTEFRLRSKTGEWVPVEAVGNNMLEAPAIRGIIITAREITARKAAEKEVLRLKVLNEHIVQGVAEGIVLQDAKGLITFHNPAAAAILGYQPGELDGKHWIDIIPKDQHSLVKAVLKRRKQGVSDRYELPMQCKNGSRIIAWVSGSPRFEEGEFRGVMAVFTDISERKETEVRIRRLLEQQLVINSLSLSLGELTDLNAIYRTTGEMVKNLMDVDAFIVSVWDPHQERIKTGFAYAYGEYFDPQEIPDFVAGEGGDFVFTSTIENNQPQYIADYVQFLAAIGAQGEAPEQLNETHRHLLKLIEIYTRSALAVPMNVGRETIGRMIVHSRHPNAYRQEQIDLLWAMANIAAIAIQNAQLLEQARRSADQIQQILQTVPEGMLLLDDSRRVVTANPAATQYLSLLAGIDVGGVLARLGESELDRLLVPQPGGLWHEVSAGGRVFEVTASPMVSGPAQGGWVLVLREVTHEREVERRNQVQERLATVGQMAAGIAHDFNNIMSTIVLYAQMSIQSPWMTRQDRERMSTIYQQAMHATDLIRQILDFSRRAVLERQPLSLRPLVKEQVRLFERTLVENIRIELDGLDQRCVVYADPTRLQQVLMNLALNARDAMPDGGTLRIGLHLIEIHSPQAAPLPEMAPGKWVRLMVADSGVGIEPQDLAHIFEPFFTTKGRGEGSGLGLAQVYGIVSQHEGFIDVQSEPGKGSVFSIYLPALPEDLTDLPDLDTGPLVRGGQQTILVVEDSLFTRQALVDSLEMLNYRTLTASNGREALDLLLEHNGEIDLVISDVIMPEMSGLGLVREMLDQGIMVRTILLTGHFPGKEMDDLRKRGVVELLDKPPSLEKLSETVGAVLGKR